jgi:hypothetical protein
MVLVLYNLEAAIRKLAWRNAWIMAMMVSVGCEAEAREDRS